MALYDIKSHEDEFDFFFASSLASLIVFTFIYVRFPVCLSFIYLSLPVALHVLPER